MMVRPNFESVTMDDTHVTVSGRSDPDEFRDVISIRVVLVQENVTDGDNADVIKGRRDAGLDAAWSVQLLAGDFKPGPAVAFGVETHQDNFLTFTWGEPVKIEKK